MNLQESHRQLIVLGLEVAFVLALSMVANASPGWGAPALVLVLLLWGVFLLGHSSELTGLLGGGAKGAEPAPPAPVASAPAKGPEPRP